MTRDLLKDATKALSESGHEQRGAQFTRERLMASLHERKRRHRSRFTVMLPLAAVFVGSTAFATVTGKLEAVVVSALNVVGIQLDSTGQAAAPDGEETGTSKAAFGGHRDRAPARDVDDQSQGVDSAEPEAVAAPEPEQVAERAAVAPSPPRASRALSAPSVAEIAGDHAAPSDSRAQSDDAHAVYRRAHHAQFRDDEPARALAGYEKYLAQQPGGRFAVDARYNRALCLVRMGRMADARPVLDAFARGDFGGYRQKDAARLLLALGEAEQGSRGEADESSR